MRARRRLNSEKKRVIEYLEANPTATVKQINDAITPSLPVHSLDTWLVRQGYKKIWQKVN